MFYKQAVFERPVDNSQNFETVAYIGTFGA